MRQAAQQGVAGLQLLSCLDLCMDFLKQEQHAFDAIEENNPSGKETVHRATSACAKAHRLAPDTPLELEGLQKGLPLGRLAPDREFVSCMADQLVPSEAAEGAHGGVDLNVSPVAQRRNASRVGQQLQHAGDGLGRDIDDSDTIARKIKVEIRVDHFDAMTDGLGHGSVGRLERSDDVGVGLLARRVAPIQVTARPARTRGHHKRVARLAALEAHLGLPPDVHAAQFMPVFSRR